MAENIFLKNFKNPYNSMTWRSLGENIHKYDTVCCENIITKQKVYGFFITSWNFKYPVAVAVEKGTRAIQEFGRAEAFKIYRGTNRKKTKRGYIESCNTFINGAIGKGAYNPNECFYPEIIMSEDRKTIDREYRFVIIYSARVVIFEKAILGL